MNRGKLIAFEGGDGMGKATQSKLLADKLGAKLISFPRYETEIGEAIRGSCRGDWAACLLESTGRRGIPTTRLNALARQALFLLDRCDAAPTIEGYLASGVNVVLDRYWPSGVIYGADDGPDKQLLIRAHSILPQPDVWILLDGSVEESFRRRPERQDNYERDAEGALRRRHAYLDLFRQRGRFMHKSSCSDRWDGSHEPIQPRICNCDDRFWFIVDALGTVDEVRIRIWAKLRELFGRDFIEEK